MPTTELNDEHRPECRSASTQTGQVQVRSAKPHPVWWVIAVSLAVIALSMVFRDQGGLTKPVFAQSTMSAGAHGTFAFSGQISKNAYGIFMVDVDAGTLWCYRLDQGGDKLKLVAGRDWRYDRYLENYSTEPPPEFIKMQLEQERSAKQKASGNP
ncbi:MAG: hypothetical protein DHS20C16_16120 [Phycisphaerae bacterium]|nr:MAG: hypothetical protein DHS20C16_16120 [Phycisphaerae bacterium]